MTYNRPSILLIDNFDSFTYNLFDYLQQAGAKIDVIRNDAVSVPEIIQKQYNGIVLSPGPKTPREAGELMTVIAELHDQLPMLGICLGHQGIGQYFGASLVKARIPVHGKTSIIHHHQEHWFFKDIPNPTEVMRYHSLILKEVPSEQFAVLSRTIEGEIMAIAHKQHPLIGVQFHPESILSKDGKQMIYNWVEQLSLGSYV